MFNLDDIPIGSENAISRGELADRFGCSDRAVRRRIAELRCMDGGRFVIVSYSSNGTTGYYRTDNAAEISHFVNEMQKRARNTIQPIRNARRVLKEMHREGLAG